jgi:hypothetical protein
MSTVLFASTDLEVFASPRCWCFKQTKVPAIPDCRSLSASVADRTRIVEGGCQRRCATASGAEGKQNRQTTTQAVGVPHQTASRLPRHTAQKSWKIRKFRQPRITNHRPRERHPGPTHCLTRKRCPSSLPKRMATSNWELEPKVRPCDATHGHLYDQAELETWFAEARGRIEAALAGGTVTL